MPACRRSRQAAAACSRYPGSARARAAMCRKRSTRDRAARAGSGHRRLQFVKLLGDRLQLCRGRLLRLCGRLRGRRLSLGPLAVEPLAEFALATIEVAALLLLRGVRRLIKFGLDHSISGLRIVVIDRLSHRRALQIDGLRERWRCNRRRRCKQHQDGSGQPPGTLSLDRRHHHAPRRAQSLRV